MSDPGYQEIDGEQKAAVNDVVAGRNVFITGPGRKVLKCCIKALASFGKQYAVTASTGLAGDPIGGITLHSFAGIGIP